MLTLDVSRSWQNQFNRVKFWSFENMYSEERCWAYTRFHMDSLPRLLKELELDNPGTGDGKWRCKWYEKDVRTFQPMELLIIFLARLAGHEPWVKLQEFLGGRCHTDYVVAFYFVCVHVWSRFSHCITDITRWSEQAADFAAAIKDSDAPAPNCIGFVDGTFRATCRPNLSEKQKAIYNGYYGAHGFKFQSVVGPNGLIIDFFSACTGKESDSGMLRKSLLLDRLRFLAQAMNQIYYVYGDPAYPLSAYCLRGYKGSCSPTEKWFTSKMNKVRICVENGFQLIVRDWKYVDWEANLQPLKGPVAIVYCCAALFTNIKTCVTAEEHDGYGNYIAEKFNISPPSLHNYLHPACTLAE